MNIDHLGICTQPIATLFRLELMKDIINILGTMIASHDGRRLLIQWSHHNDLKELLLCMCPFRSTQVVDLLRDIERHHHYIRCMMGAFTEAESNSIIHKLTQSSPPHDESLRKVMGLIRLKCVESLGTFFSNLKV